MTLTRLPHEAGISAVGDRLTAGPLGSKVFDILGHRPETLPHGHHSYKFNRLKEYKRDWLLRCLSGTNNLRDAFQICGSVGAVLAILVCDAVSRGEALLLGCTSWHRSNTDGNTFLSYSLRRAGYDVVKGRINLYGNVTMYPFHIQLLSALVVRGFYWQCSITYTLRVGACLQEFAANYAYPMAASDIVSFLLDCEVLAALSAGINRANCWAGIDHAEALMRLALIARLCAKYGFPMPAVVLAAGNFPPVYSALSSIHDKNYAYVLKKKEMLRRVVKGELPGLRVVCVDPSLGVPSTTSFLFPRALVCRIRNARTRELAELSRQEPSRSLIEMAARLSARLPVRRGLRYGNSHPEWVPTVGCLPDVFIGKFGPDGGYNGTLLLAIAIEYQTVDGEPLLRKDGTPPLQLIGAARAKRDSLVRAGGGGSERVEQLRARDAYRDVVCNQVVPMLGASLRDIRSVICDCVVAAAVAADAKFVYFVERTVAAAVAKDAKHALKEAAKAARAERKRQRDADAADAAARKLYRDANATERATDDAFLACAALATDAAFNRLIQPGASRIAAEVPSAPAAHDPSFYATSSDADFYASLGIRPQGSAADQNALLAASASRLRR